MKMWYIKDMLGKKVLQNRRAPDNMRLQPVIVISEEATDILNFNNTTSSFVKQGETWPTEEYIKVPLIVVQGSNCVYPRGVKTSVYWKDYILYCMFSASLSRWPEI